MGSGDQRSMRFWCLLMLCLMLELVSAQKGGAKGAMRNRGRGGGGAGRRGGAGRNDGDDDDDIASILERYDYSKPRPCVGLCYIKKLQGQGPIKYPKKEDRKPCVGMCHRNRMKGIRSALKLSRKEKPCVGLCYIKKLKKKSRKHRVVE